MHVGGATKKLHLSEVVPERLEPRVGEGSAWSVHSESLDIPLQETQDLILKLPKSPRSPEALAPKRSEPLGYRGLVS